MKLRLYKPDTVDFNNNGIGILTDAFNATVHEVANGELTLTFSYPVNGLRFGQLNNGYLVVAKPNAIDDDHAFRIITSVPDFSGMYTTITAESITNDLRGVPVQNFSWSETAQTNMKQLSLSASLPSLLTINTNITSKGTVSGKMTNVLALIAGTDPNSFISVFGGELQRRNRQLNLLSRRGREYPIKFSLHKNINGIKITTDTSNVTTGILPYIEYTKDSKTVTLVGSVVMAKNYKDYAVQNIVPTAIPGRQTPTEGETVSDPTLPIIETVAQLNTAAVKYFTGTSFAKASYPTVTVEIDVASVQRSTEYSEFSNITDIGLFDAVKVDLAEYNMSADMIVKDIEFDPLAERVTKVTLGDLKGGISSTIKSQYDNLQKAVELAKQTAVSAVISANGKNTNTYGAVKPSNPQDGDVWFQEDGDYKAIWMFTDGQWVRLVDSDTQKRIADGVDEAVAQATSTATAMVNSNAVATASIASSAASASTSLAIERGNFASVASSYAKNAVTTAEATTKSIAASTASSLATSNATALSSAQATLSSAIKAGDSQAASAASSALTSLSSSMATKITALSAGLTQTNSQVALTATKADLDATKKDYTAQIASVNVQYNNVTTTVSQLQAKVNEAGQINQLFNTEFSPDWQGWHDGLNYTDADKTKIVTDSWTFDNTKYQGSNVIKRHLTKDIQAIHSDFIPVGAGVSVMGKVAVKNTTDYVGSYAGAMMFSYYDSTKKLLSSVSATVTRSDDKWQFVTLSKTTPDKTVYMMVGIFTNGTVGDVYLSQPMLVFDTKIGDYVPGQYNNNGALATQKITIDGITQSVSKITSDVSAITTRVQTAEGVITTAENDITGLTSQQTQLANQIVTEITDRKNGDTNLLTTAQNYTQSQITSATTSMKTTITQTADGLLAQVEAGNMVTNSEFDPINTTLYTMSSTTGSSLGSVNYVTTNTAFNDWPVVNGSQLISYREGTWYSTVLRPAKAGQPYSASIVAGRISGTATTAFNLRIAFWDTNKKLIKTVSASNLINGVTTKDIAKYSFNNQVAPANTAYVSLVIAHSSDQALDVVGRMMLNPGTTAAPYVPTYGTDATSTVLSLLKDNWSIGITDNVGKIVSGIVGNASQMSLISKNVIIDSPSTQITGTAWINRAMIKDGAIGSAQIGKAAIQTANVGTLDVNVLAGNISSFIQSNWNGIYGSTTIDAYGMKITTSGVTTTFDSMGMDLNMAGENVGGIGVNGMVDMPDTYQGLLFWLNGLGDYMAWAARDNGNQTMNPKVKLAWYRGGSYTRPSDTIAGFNFDDDVQFNNPIHVHGVGSQTLSFMSQTFNNNDYPYLGDSRGKAGFAYGSTETYLLSNGTYYNASRVIRALDNQGTWSIPLNIDSTGTVTKWRNVTT